MRKTEYEHRYIDQTGNITGRRNAIASRFFFYRIHPDGHKYGTNMDAQIGIYPPGPTRIMADRELDEYLYDYDTNGDHEHCTHPLGKIWYSNEEYGGSRCTICDEWFRPGGRP